MMANDDRTNDCSRSEPEISALLDGELPAPAAAVVEAHLRTCDACTVLARDLAAVSRTLRAVEPPDVPAERGSPSLSAGFRARVLSRMADERGRAPAPRPVRAAAPVHLRTVAPSARSALSPLLAAAAVALVFAGTGALLWNAVTVEDHDRSAVDAASSASTGSPPAAAPSTAGAFLARAADHERAGRADLARRDVLTAYGLDPRDPRVREAVERTLGFDPDGLDRALAAGGGDGAPSRDGPAPAGAGSGEPFDAAGGGYRFLSWEFDTPEAYDRFLRFRDLSRELEMAHAAREARAAETTSVAPERAAPAAPNPLAATLASLTVGRPVGGGGGTSASYDGITLYPLLSGTGNAFPGAVPLTLEEALEHGRVTVRDPLRSDATTVLISNDSHDRPLLVLAGEVLEGGRSDRMVARDVLVPAGAKNLPVPVYDVEVGKRSGTWASRFKTTPGVGGAMLRGLALAQAPPEVISSFVRGRLDMLFVKSSRRSFVDAFNERGPAQQVLRGLRPRVEELLQGLRSEEITGFAVAHRRQILALEVFGSHRLMMRHAPRLLEGYALEAATFTGGGLPPSRERVEAMVQAAAGGSFFRGSAGDAAEYGVLSSEGGLLGCGIVSGDALYHAAVLSGAGAAAIRGEREGRPGDFPGASGGPGGGSGEDPGGSGVPGGQGGSGGGDTEGTAPGSGDPPPSPPPTPPDRDR